MWNFPHILCGMKVPSRFCILMYFPHFQLPDGIQGFHSSRGYLAAEHHRAGPFQTVFWGIAAGRFLPRAHFTQFYAAQIAPDRLRLCMQRVSALRFYSSVPAAGFWRMRRAAYLDWSSEEIEGKSQAKDFSAPNDYRIKAVATLRYSPEFRRVSNS
jgi:hypothetical protein